MIYQTAEQKRDSLIRRRILSVLFEARSLAPLEGYGARKLLNLIASNTVVADDGIQDDDHAMALLISLRDSGYLTMEDQRRVKSVRYGVDVLFLKITDKGGRFCQNLLPVDPMIDDERIG